MFHYVKAGRPFGPVSGQDLQALLDGGVLEPDDAVRPEGESEWSSAREVLDRIRSGQLSVEAAPGSSRPGSAYTVYTSLSPPALSVALPPLVQTGVGCGGCGTEARDGAAFCRRCGRALARRQCAACKRPNEQDAVFCDACGTRLGGRV